MVNKVLERPRGKRGAYPAPAQKYSTGKHATDSGITTTIRHVVECD